MTLINIDFYFYYKRLYYKIKLEVNLMYYFFYIINFTSNVQNKSSNLVSILFI